MPLPLADLTVDFNALPLRHDLLLHQNATFWWKGKLTYTNESGVTTNVDMADATAAELCLEAKDGARTLVPLVNLEADGDFEILLTPADLHSLEPGIYAWDCDLVFPSGSTSFPDGASLRLFEGKATLMEEISFSSSSSSSSA